MSRKPREFLLDGKTVYELIEDDFGQAEHDSHETGFKHISVTSDPRGDYPGFTVPECDLKELKPLSVRELVLAQ